MSGITGIYRRDGRLVDPVVLRGMLDRIAHRGPDGSEVCVAGQAGLGHCMLHTTPESLGERLPVTSPDSGALLTSDARIDNRLELITLLGLNEVSASAIADSTLILKAYERWGEACPHHLVGVFAFAIWDARRQRLFCARDQLGVKPFYYVDVPGHAFYWASEIKSFAAVEGITLTIDETRIADFLDLRLEDKASTSYAAVKRLPPAHTMTVDLYGLRIAQYWSLDPEKEIRYATQEAYDAAFRALFREAVRCRMRSTSPVGAQLSGGLDSTAVCCVASDLLQAPGEPHPINTFSNIFEAVPACDERDYIEHVLARGGFNPVYVNADQTGPLTDWDAASTHEDEAFTTANHYLVWGLLRAAQEQGTRVVLDGFDGDTTVSHGVYFFDELARAGDWAAFFREAKMLAERHGSNPVQTLRRFGLVHLEHDARRGAWGRFFRAVNAIARHFNLSRWSLLMRHGLSPRLPPSVVAWIRGIRQGGPTHPGRVVNRGEALRIINAAFAERLGRKAQRVTEEQGEIPATTTLRAFQCEALQSGALAYVLELYDRAAAALGLEVRHPFIDRRLVEFCVALPPEQKLHNGWTRWILRSALQAIMPPEICWRIGKANMEPNHYRGLLLHRERFEALLSSEDLQAIAPYVDLDVVRAAYERLRDGRMYAQYPRDLSAVWNALSLFFWLRRTDVLGRACIPSS